MDLYFDFYALLLGGMEPRIYSNKLYTKQVVKEAPVADIQLQLDKTKVHSSVSSFVLSTFPDLKPLLEVKTVFKKVTERQVVNAPPPKNKDIFLEAQEAYFGHGKQKNLKEALELYQEAENRGYVKASNCLGLMYLKGEGVSQDVSKARAHFQKAISSKLDTNDPRSEGKEDGYYWIGFMYYNNLIAADGGRDSNLNEAIKYYDTAARCGQSQAMCDLGLIYEQGLRGETDLVKAKQYYEQSVEKSNPMAMDNLGVFLLKEEEKFQSENCKKRAYELFERAKSMGYKKSLTNLGIMYLKGIYVQRDLVNAKDLFKKAASGDNPDIEAKYYLAYFKLKEASMSQDELKFEEVADDLRFILATNREHSEANYYMGFLYENGLGTDKDLKSAIKHFKKAMESDPMNSKARYKVANYYASGEGHVYPDKNRAFQLYQEAANQGNSDAQIAIGAFYETGQVVEKDLNKARQYYQLAAQAGNSGGLYNLGIAQMNDKSQDSKLRSHMAMEYMQKAAQGGNDRAKDFISKFGNHFVSVLNSAVARSDPESTGRDEPREQVIITYMNSVEHNKHTTLDNRQLQYLEMVQRMFKQFSEAQGKFITEILLIIFKEASSRDSDGTGFRLTELSLSRSTSLINSVLSRSLILGDEKSYPNGTVGSFADELTKAYEDIFKAVHKDSKGFNEALQKKRRQYQAELLAENSPYRTYIEYVPEYHAASDQQETTTNLISESSLIEKRDLFGYYYLGPVQLRMIESPSLKRDTLNSLGDFQYYCRSIDTTEKFSKNINTSDHYFRVIRKNRRDGQQLIRKVSDSKEHLTREVQDNIDQILDCLVIIDRSSPGDTLVLLVSHKKTKEYLLFRTSNMDLFMKGNAEKVWISQKMSDNMSNSRLTTNNLLAKTDSHIFFLSKDMKDNKHICMLKSELITQKAESKIPKEGNNKNVQELANLSLLPSHEIEAYKIDAQKNAEGHTSVAVAILSGNGGNYKITLYYTDDFCGVSKTATVLNTECPLDKRDSPTLTKVAIANGEVLVLVGTGLYYLNKRGRDASSVTLVRLDHNFQVFDLWSAVGRFVVRRASNNPAQQVFSSLNCSFKTSLAQDFSKCEEPLEFNLSSHLQAFNNSDFSGSVSQSFTSDFSTLIVMIGRPKDDGRSMEDKTNFTVFSMVVEPETLI